MNSAAITANVADCLEAVLADWTEKEETWANSLENSQDHSNAVEICPTILSTNMLPGLDKPKHWLHSMARHQAWFENEVEKQLQEKSQHESNAASTSSMPSSFKAQGPSSSKKQSLSLN